MQYVVQKQSDGKYAVGLKQLNYIHHKYEQAGRDYYNTKDVYNYSFDVIETFEELPAAIITTATLNAALHGKHYLLDSGSDVSVDKIITDTLLSIRDSQYSTAKSFPSPDESSAFSAGYRAAQDAVGRLVDRLIQEQPWRKRT